MVTGFGEAATAVNNAAVLIDPDLSLFPGHSTDEDLAPESVDCRNGEADAMTYVIGKECIDALDRSCVDVCPVDCIYEGERKNYINASRVHRLRCLRAGLPRGRDLPGSPRQGRRGARGVHRRQPRLLRAAAARAARSRWATPAAPRRSGPIGVDTPLVSDWG